MSDDDDVVDDGNDDVDEGPEEDEGPEDGEDDAEDPDEGPPADALSRLVALLAEERIIQPSLADFLR